MEPTAKLMTVGDLLSKFEARKGWGPQDWGAVLFDLAQHVAALTLNVAALLRGSAPIATGVPVSGGGTRDSPSSMTSDQLRVNLMKERDEARQALKGAVTLGEHNSKRLVVDGALMHSELQAAQAKIGDLTTRLELANSSIEGWASSFERSEANLARAHTATEVVRTDLAKEISSHLQCRADLDEERREHTATRRLLTETSEHLDAEREVTKRVTLAYERGVEIWRAHGNSMSLPPTRIELVEWLLQEMQDRREKSERREREVSLVIGERDQLLQAVPRGLAVVEALFDDPLSDYAEANEGAVEAVTRLRAERDEAVHSAESTLARSREIPALLARLDAVIRDVVTVALAPGTGWADRQVAIKRLPELMEDRNQLYSFEGHQEKERQHYLDLHTHKIGAYDEELKNWRSGRQTLAG